MHTYFQSEFFSGNRERLKATFKGTAPIIITANGLLQRSTDNTFPFRQDSNFWYLTGLDDPDLILVIDKDKEYIIVPGRSDIRQAFDGSVDIQYIQERSGITDVVDESAGWKRLKKRVKNVLHVATIAPGDEYVEAHGFYTNPSKKRLVQQLKTIQPNVELLDIRNHMIRMRMVKQTPELAAIQQAVDVTIDAFRQAKLAAAESAHEYQVEAVMTGCFRHNGFDHAYTPIVASGANACTLHYLANKAAIDKKDVILLDVGAQVENYAADISRSYAVSRPTKRQKQVWEAVVAVQDYAIGLLKPSTTIRETENMVEQFMGEKLRELGLIKTITHESVRQYYPHATSHHLGLDVHDIADYDVPLTAGNVITVEPGIYIPEEGIGIRIEDDLLITADGNKNLSQNLDRSL